MKRNLLIAFTMSLAILFPFFSHSAHAEETETPTATEEVTEGKEISLTSGLVEYVMINGMPSEDSITSTLHYLFPKDVFVLNNYMLDFYIQNPDKSYTEAVDIPQQNLYYRMGQYIAPYQAQAFLHESAMLGIKHPILSPKSISSVQVNPEFYPIYYQAIHTYDMLTFDSKH